MENIHPDHERLVRLLALKRHEVPPPGYFDRFAGRVLLHIKAGQAHAPEPWWLRLREWFVTEPALAGSYAMLVAGGLFFVLSIYHLSERNTSPTHLLHSGFGAAAAMPAPAFDAASDREAQNIRFRLQDHAASNAPVRGPGR